MIDFYKLHEIVVTENEVFKLDTPYNENLLIKNQKWFLEADRQYAEMELRNRAFESDLEKTLFLVRPSNTSGMYEIMLKYRNEIIYVLIKVTAANEFFLNENVKFKSIKELIQMHEIERFTVDGRNYKLDIPFSEASAVTRYTRNPIKKP